MSNIMTNNSNNHNRSVSPNDGWLFAAGTFAFSSWYYLRKMRRDKLNSSLYQGDGPYDHLYRRLPRHKPALSIYDTDSNSGSNKINNSEHYVSSRGMSALSPPIPYLKQFLACLNDLCDPQENPQGHVALCVAENKLVLDMMADRFMHPSTSTAAFSNPSVYCYNSFLGMPIARESCAYFLARRFLYPDDADLTTEKAFAAISPNHVALGSGAASLINALFFLLGESGEACLIPRPYYAAFENDMNLVAGIVPCGITQANPVAGPTDEELEMAHAETRAKGLRPKFLLLTNPNNPLGIIYRKATVLRVVQWARKRNMHVIVDEIYALSTHKKDNHGFESIVKILDNQLGNDVHFLWAVSKDFGSSGLRCGFIYSQNDVFMEGLATFSIFHSVSGPIQYLVADLLTDDAFVDSFLEESRSRILQSYQICTDKLKEMVVPYTEAEAGLFVYVDFSSLLPERTFAMEEQLSDIMFKHARLVLTPGESQRDTIPGMFRICYAWTTPDVLMVAMERLSRLVAKLRRTDWSDLDDPRAMVGILD